jgi:hypothetical protein
MDSTGLRYFAISDRGRSQYHWPSQRNERPVWIVAHIGLRTTGLRPFARSDVSDSSRVQVRPASAGCSQRAVRAPLGETDRDQSCCNVVWHHRERPTQSNSAEPFLRLAVQVDFLIHDAVCLNCAFRVRSISGQRKRRVQPRLRDQHDHIYRGRQRAAQMGQTEVNLQRHLRVTAGATEHRREVACLSFPTVGNRPLGANTDGSVTSVTSSGETESRNATPPSPRNALRIWLLLILARRNSSTIQLGDYEAVTLA